MIGAQLVTADGEVLELGPGRNENLFWAIRGGGGNFGIVTRLDFRLHPLRTQHSASFRFGWNDIAGAMRTFGELIRETPDEVRASFRVEKDAGAVASCGHYGDPAAATAYHAKWKAMFRWVEPQMRNSIPTPQGEVWATTSLAVDGAFLEGMTDDGLVDVLARAAVARARRRCDAHGPLERRRVTHRDDRHRVPAARHRAKQSAVGRVDIGPRSGRARSNG